jgi:hypothetical protein
VIKAPTAAQTHEKILSASTSPTTATGSSSNHEERKRKGEQLVL